MSTRDENVFKELRAMMAEAQPLLDELTATGRVVRERPLHERLESNDAQLVAYRAAAGRVISFLSSHATHVDKTYITLFVPWILDQELREPK